jgi:hypothetical protein
MINTVYVDLGNDENSDPISFETLQKAFDELNNDDSENHIILSKNTHTSPHSGKLSRNLNIHIEGNRSFISELILESGIVKIENCILNDLDVSNTNLTCYGCIIKHIKLEKKSTLTLINCEVRDEFNILDNCTSQVNILSSKLNTHIQNNGKTSLIMNHSTFNKISEPCVISEKYPVNISISDSNLYIDSLNKFNLASNSHVSINNTFLYTTDDSHHHHDCQLFGGDNRTIHFESSNFNVVIPTGFNNRFNIGSNITITDDFKYVIKVTNPHSNNVGLMRN